MEEYDYLMDALHCFNTDVPNWFGWKTHDDDGNKIEASKRMTYDNVKIIDDKATMPSKSDVETKIQELKDAETTKANNKTSAINKLKVLGLSDDELTALRLN
jgi:hypothetical protein